MDVLIHHRGLNRTVSVPAVAAPAWAADGWEIATDEQAATVHSVGAEQELAKAERAEADIAAAALAEIKNNPSSTDDDVAVRAATAGAVETATTNKEQKP